MGIKEQIQGDVVGLAVHTTQVKMAVDKEDWTKASNQLAALADTLGTVKERIDLAKVGSGSFDGETKLMIMRFIRVSQNNALHSTAPFAGESLSVAGCLKKRLEGKGTPEGDAVLRGMLIENWDHTLEVMEERE